MIFYNLKLTYPNDQYRMNEGLEKNLKLTYPNYDVFFEERDKMITFLKRADGTYYGTFI